MDNNSSNQPAQFPVSVIFIDETETHSNPKNRNNSRNKPNQHSNVFAGGFKYRPQEPNAESGPTKSILMGNHSQKEQSKGPKESQINQMTVYDQFGLLNERVGKSKFRPEEQSEAVNAVNGNISQIKQARQQKYSHLLAGSHTNDEFYQIADLKSRQQVAEHVKSSLDTFTLQNVEAKLQAHRQQLSKIEKVYNVKKGKPMAVNRFGESELKFNIDVDKEYNELHQNDPTELYQLIKNKQNKEVEELELDQLWEEKKRKNPRLAEYDRNYQEYLVEKDAKNIIGHSIKNNISTWDRFTQPEHEKVNAPLRKAHRHQGSKSKEKSIDAEQDYGNDGLMGIKDLGDVIATKDDKFIAKYIMVQIDQGKKGVISKQEFYDYISSRQHIIQGYLIDVKWLYTDLDNFETKRKGLLTREEISLFLASIEKIHRPTIALVSQKQPNTSSSTANNQQNTQFKNNFKVQQHVFKKLFTALDVNDDHILKREEFIENIFIDSECVELLDQVAIQIKIIDKSITYRQIISYMLEDYRKERNSKLKKSKEYISFQRFCEYFDLPETLDLRQLGTTNRKQASATEQHTIFDLEAEYMQLLKDIFDTIPRVYQDYAVSIDFVQTALKDPQVLILGDQLCRIKSVETSLPIETIRTTLHRMLKECEEYTTWDDLKLFFSRRGRPLDWNYQLILKKREIREQKLKTAVQTTSIFRNNSTAYQDKSSSPRKSIGKKISVDRYTVPQPFNITDEKEKPEKQNRRAIEEGEEEFTKLKKQFKAMPVNKEILEPKPDLILGKKKEKSVHKSLYKYENYENDRIERALKKAEEEHALEEQKRTLKEKTEYKARDIGIDLTKKYQDIVKKNKSKHKPTEPKVSKNLYPDDIVKEKLRQLEKTKANLNKVEEAQKLKEKQKDETKNKAKERNQAAKKLTQERKKLEEEETKEREKVDNDFKPKINKHQLSEAEKGAAQKAKEERERKKKETQQRILEAQQQRKKKILGYEKKEAKLNIEGLTDDEILERINEVDFEDLLLDESSKAEFRKEYDLKDKSKIERRNKYAGLAGRERAFMEEEERRIMDEKRKFKEKKQDKNVNDQMSAISETGQKGALQKDLAFNQSKALRRYRALMEGKDPLSEFDKYSVAFNDNQHDI